MRHRDLEPLSQYHNVHNIGQKAEDSLEWTTLFLFPLTMPSGDAQATSRNKRASHIRDRRSQVLENDFEVFVLLNVTQVHPPHASSRTFTSPRHLAKDSELLGVSHRARQNYIRCGSRRTIDRWLVRTISSAFLNAVCLRESRAPSRSCAATSVFACIAHRY